MIGIDKDNFKVLIRGILIDPIRVEHAKVSTFATCTLLSYGAFVALELKLSDTLMLRLTILNTLLHRTLATSATDTH